MGHQGNVGGGPEILQCYLLPDPEALAAHSVPYTLIHNFTGKGAQECATAHLMVPLPVTKQGLQRGVEWLNLIAPMQSVNILAARIGVAVASPKANSNSNPNPNHYYNYNPLQ